MMMSNSRSPSRKGFSLVELLTVLAVVGILIAILIPVAGTILENARRTAASNDLRQIALAYRAYAQEGARPRQINVDTIHQWAATLAEFSALNTPDIYIQGDDPLVERETRPLPRVIANPPATGGGRWTLNPEFDGFPLSVAVANGLASRADASTTPVTWTRGLGTNGSWAPLTDANPGVYGDRGGHIAFLDGHVTFYSNLTEEGGRLLHFTTRQPTSNIQEALNPGAQGLESTGRRF
jgi:prepilin-type N-terminal cleavage/methylation domain-containing protein/prepilin-type processing-associated H-X9-DG protein